VQLDQWFWTWGSWTIFGRVATRVDTLCAQLYYICFIRVLDGGRWLIVSRTACPQFLAVLGQPTLHYSQMHITGNTLTVDTLKFRICNELISNRIVNKPRKIKAFVKKQNFRVEPRHKRNLIGNSRQLDHVAYVIVRVQVNVDKHWYLKTSVQGCATHGPGAERSRFYIECDPWAKNLKVCYEKKSLLSTFPYDHTNSPAHGIRFVQTIGVARGAKGPCPPKFLENIVILCLDRRFSKQNGVISLKSNILVPQNPPQNFWAGYTTDTDPLLHKYAFRFLKGVANLPWVASK